MPSTAPAAAPGLPPKPAFVDPHIFPDRYGLEIVGHCMAPAYPEGSKVEVAKSEPYGHGDVVALWWRPELVAAGCAPCMIKRVVMMPAPWVTGYPYKDCPKSDVAAVIMLVRDDRPEEMMRIRCADVLAIHKCVGILAAGEWHDARPGAGPRPSRRRALR